MEEDSTSEDSNRVSGKSLNTYNITCVCVLLE